MINKMPEEAQKEIEQGLVDIFGTPPQDRLPGDMTQKEIVAKWGIAKEKVYDMVVKGLLERVKVFDKNTGKTAIVYRPVMEE